MQRASLSFLSTSSRIGACGNVDVVAVVKEVSEVPPFAVERQYRTQQAAVLVEIRQVDLIDALNALAEQGEQLASMTNPIVAIRSVRVGDYEGVSIGTVSRSDMVIDPDADTVPRAAELKKWWDETAPAMPRRPRSRLRASGSKEGHHRHQPRRVGRDRPCHR